MKAWWVTLGTLLVAACRPDAFFCADDGQCLQAGVAGTCEVSGVCSFPDEACDSGQRFGEFAGALANTCVPAAGTTSSDGGVSSSSGGPVAGDAPESDGAVDGTSTGMNAAATTTGEGGSSSSTGEPVTSGGTGFPDGTQCNDPSECQSMHCPELGALGGVCSECTTDEDCRFGCAPPNPLTRPITPGACDDGSLGSACQTNAACQNDLSCALILDVAGIATYSSCSECDGEVACDEGEVCNVTIDLAAIAGQRECVVPGTRPNGATCWLDDGIGEAACANHCEAISVMGVVQVGVCGDCRDAGDCSSGGVCVPGSIDLPGQITPSSCG